jgi:anti-anti-sigma factor
VWNAAGKGAPVSRAERLPGLSLVWHEQDGLRWVTATGEIDLSNAAAFSRVLASPRLHVDLSEVVFIDSAGIRCLVEARMNSIDFELIASRVVRKVLEIASVTALLGAATDEEPESEPA